MINGTLGIRFQARLKPDLRVCLSCRAPRSFSISESSRLLLKLLRKQGKQLGGFSAFVESRESNLLSKFSVVHRASIFYIVSPRQVEQHFRAFVRNLTKEILRKERAEGSKRSLEIISE